MTPRSFYAAIILALVAALTTGCSKGSSSPAGDSGVPLSDYEPSPQVDASAAAEYVTVEFVSTEGVPPRTVLMITCTVCQKGTLEAEWITPGRTTETAELAVKGNPGERVTLYIDPIRCALGEKVVLGPKS